MSKIYYQLYNLKALFEFKFLVVFMFKFLISFVLILQVFASDLEPLLARHRRGGADSSAANVMPAFDYATDQTGSRQSLPRANTSEAAANPTTKTLKLHDGIARVPISVLQQIIGKDCSHLLKRTSDMPYAEITAQQLQTGLEEFDKLLGALSGVAYDINALISGVRKMPCVLVQFKEGSVAVSERIHGLFKSGKQVQTEYSPLELLMINLCGLQAKAVSLLG